jgi:hypothetical protein
MARSKLEKGRRHRRRRGVTEHHEVLRGQPGHTRPDTTTRRRSAVTAAIAPAHLTAADRCDRCGARAYIEVRLPGGGELLFCAHHGRAHSDALRAADADIHDETHALDETRPTAPDGER